MTGSVHWCCFLFFLLGQLAKSSSPAHTWEHWHAQKQIISFDWARGLAFTILVVTLICKWHHRTATSPQENIVSMDFASYKVVIGATGIKLNAISKKHKDWLVFFLYFTKETQLSTGNTIFTTFRKQSRNCYIRWILNPFKFDFWTQQGENF